MQKIQLAKKDGNFKAEEVYRSILGILNSYSLKTGKPVDFKKRLPYALFTVHLSISNPNESRQHTVKSKLNDILLQRNSDSKKRLIKLIFEYTKK